VAVHVGGEPMRRRLHLIDLASTYWIPAHKNLPSLCRGPWPGTSPAVSDRRPHQATMILSHRARRRRNPQNIRRLADPTVLYRKRETRSTKYETQAIRTAFVSGFDIRVSCLRDSHRGFR
jgi:hypothetical protein